MMLTDRFAYTTRSVADRKPGIVRLTMTIAPAMDSPKPIEKLGHFLRAVLRSRHRSARNQDFALDMVRNLAVEIIGDIDSTTGR